MNKYYISTGALEVFYTLRYTFEDVVYFGGQSHAVLRDYHITNLSLDRNEAITKAKALIAARNASPNALELDDTFLLENKRRIAGSIDRSVFRAGKYTGKSIHEVAEIDKPYLVWLCSQKWQPRSEYAATAELAVALVQHELNEIASREAEEAQATASRIQAAQPVINLFSGLTVTVTHAKNGSYYTPIDPYDRPSWGAGIIANELRAGRKVSPKVVYSAIEDLLKAEGYSNRGKANQSKREARETELHNLLQPFTK